MLNLNKVEFVTVIGCKIEPNQSQPNMYDPCDEWSVTLSIASPVSVPLFRWHIWHGIFDMKSESRVQSHLHCIHSHAKSHANNEMYNVHVKS